MNTQRAIHGQRPHWALVFAVFFVACLAGLCGVLASQPAVADPALAAEAASTESALSKTATNLDENYESDITLSLPSEQTKLKSDLVLVTDVSENGLAYFQTLLGQLKKLDESVPADALDIKLVFFRGNVSQVFTPDTLPKSFTSNLNSYVNASKSSSSLMRFFANMYLGSLMSALGLNEAGSNMHGGLVKGKEVLEASDTDPSKQYLILISDGITFTWQENGQQYGVAYQTEGDEIRGTAIKADNSAWAVEHGDYDWTPSEGWEAYLNGKSELIAKTEAEKGTRHGTTSTYVGFTDLRRGVWASSVDIALAKSADLYHELASTYNVYALPQEYKAASVGNKNQYGYYFMQYLAGDNAPSYEDIESEVLYKYSAGSKLVDVMGEGTDDKGNPYKFAFIDDVSRVSLSLGATDYPATRIDDSTIGFGAANTSKDGSTYPFVMHHSSDSFTLDINVDVTNFERLQVNYSVVLTNPQEAGGTYGTYDATGEKGYEGLYTNTEAYVVPVNSDGDEGDPEYFSKPTVSYKIPVNVVATKLWDDADNQDGMRKNVTFVLMKSVGGADPVEVEGSEKTIKATATGDDLSVEWADLDGAEDGKPVTYTVEEKNVPAGYEREVRGGNGTFTIANRHVPEGISLHVEKKWSDAGNQDGMRPDSVVATLVKNGEKTQQRALLSTQNGWEYTWTGLAKYENGSEITYTVVEESVPTGYSSKVSGSMEDGFVITNSYTPETVMVAGTKTWNDADDQDGKRPDSITVHLLADGTVVDTATTSATSDWKYSFDDLPKYKAGTQIAYAVTETLVEGYSARISGYDITNSYTPGKTSVTVSKAWDDEDNGYATRPESVEVELKADGKTVDSATLASGNGWTHTFNDLDVNSKGTKIVYTVEEKDVAEGYEASVAGSVDEGFTITNTLVQPPAPNTVTIPVTKTWNDADNQDGKRPDKIVVHLLANNIDTGLSRELTAENGWHSEFSDMIASFNGEPVAYSVVELSVEGYSSRVSGDIENGFVVTNTHDIEKMNIAVNKRWVDNGNADGARPASITVRLFANGVEVSSLELSRANDWQGTFSGLDRYSNGTEINYTIKEDEVEGYTSQVSGAATTGFTVTNTDNSVTVDEDETPLTPGEGGTTKTDSGKNAGEKAKKSEGGKAAADADGDSVEIEESPTPLSDFVETGDNATIIFVLAMLVAICAGGGALALAMRRKRG